MPDALSEVRRGLYSDVDFYMGLSSFFIGKPGPGSISEALQFQSAGDRGMRMDELCRRSVTTRSGSPRSGSESY